MEKEREEIIKLNKSLRSHRLLQKPYKASVAARFLWGQNNAFPNRHTQGLPLRILSFTADVGNIRWGNIHIMRFVWFQVIISILSACARVGLHFVWCSLESGSIWRQRRLEVEAQLGQGGDSPVTCHYRAGANNLFQSCRLALAFQINRSCDIITQLLECTIPHSVCHEKAKPFINMLAWAPQMVKSQMIKRYNRSRRSGSVWGCVCVCVHRVAQTDRLDDQWSLLIKGLQK